MKANLRDLSHELRESRRVVNRPMALDEAKEKSVECKSA